MLQLSEQEGAACEAWVLPALPCSSLCAGLDNSVTRGGEVWVLQLLSLVYTSLYHGIRNGGSQADVIVEQSILGMHLVCGMCSEAEVGPRALGS